MPGDRLARRASKTGTLGMARELEPYRKPEKKPAAKASKPKKGKSQGLMNIHAQKLLRQID